MILHGRQCHASLKFGDTTYGPSELRKAIDSRIDEFRAAGLTAGRAVVLYLPLTDSYVIEVLALYRLGCCIVPVDIRTPVGVALHIAELVGAFAVSTSSGLELTGYLDEGVSSDLDLAYILFTSGTTGEPKGVGGSRRALARRLAWGDELLYSDDVTACGIANSPAFLDNLTGILGSYQAGRVIIVAPAHAQRDPGALAAFIAEQSIEQITLTPSVVLALRTAVSRSFAGMRRWIFSGEELRRDWVEWARSVSPGAEIINLYGSTEVCGDVTCFVLSPQDPVPATIPIGRSVPGVLIQLSAVDGAAAETGTHSGELWIGGDQVAAGYWRADPVPNPFRRDDSGTRWFRTGDLVSERAGMLQFHARLGDLEKIRGQRVDLSGIAALAESHPAVRAAHAWILENPDGSRSLVLEVAVKPGAQTTATAVRGYLRERSLAHLLPDRVSVVEDFARGYSGKVRPRAASLSAEPLSADRFETGTEHLIASMVSRLVGHVDVDADTEISAVGLDSLRVAVLGAQLGRILGGEITAADVLAAQTISGLAAAIPALQARSEPSPVRTVIDGAGRPVLVFVHPAVGTCLGYLPIIDRLGYQGSIVFIEQDPLAEGILVDAGISALAAHYAGLVIDVVGDRECHLFGFSFGAQLVPDLAEELRPSVTVRSVVMVDPTWHASPREVSMDWALRRILIDSGYWDATDNTAHSDPLDVEGVALIVSTSDGPLAAVSGDQLRHWASRLRSNWVAAAGFTPKSTATRQLVVRSQQSPRWASAGADTEVVLPCSHYELLHGAYLPDVADAVRTFLTEAEES